MATKHAELWENVPDEYNYSGKLGYGKYKFVYENKTGLSGHLWVKARNIVWKFTFDEEGDFIYYQETGYQSLCQLTYGNKKRVPVSWDEFIQYCPSDTIEDERWLVNWMFEDFFDHIVPL